MYLLFNLVINLIESFVSTGNFSFVKLAKKEGQSWRFNRKHGCSKSAVGRVVSTLRTCWLLLRGGSGSESQ